MVEGRMKKIYGGEIGGKYANMDTEERYGRREKTRKGENMSKKRFRQAGDFRCILHILYIHTHTRRERKYMREKNEERMKGKMGKSIQKGTCGSRYLGRKMRR